MTAKVIQLPGLSKKTPSDPNADAIKKLIPSPALTRMEDKQNAVREAIHFALRQFVGKPLDDDTRWQMATAAREAGAKKAKELRIRAPRVVVDRDKDDPRKIAVRIAFPMGGRT